MDGRQVTRRLLVPALAVVTVFVAVLFLTTRSGDSVHATAVKPVVVTRPLQPEPTAAPPASASNDSHPLFGHELGRAVASASAQSAAMNATVGGARTSYAPPDRWRKTAMPCWGIRGTAPEDFAVEVDTGTHTAGKSSASLASIRETFGWGTLYQFADAKDFRGKRIEFSADLRTAGVRNGANLLVRADDAKGNAVAMDNMWYSSDDQNPGGPLVNRQLTGDNDWSTQRIVLNIPADAAVITYGVALDGTGKVWIDNARLQTVTGETPTTAIARSGSDLAGTATFAAPDVLSAPGNLGFELDQIEGECSPQAAPR
jgi:hypothetical protein